MSTHMPTPMSMHMSIDTFIHTPPALEFLDLAQLCRVCHFEYCETVSGLGLVIVIRQLFCPRSGVDTMKALGYPGTVIAQPWVLRRWAPDL